MRLLDHVYDELLRMVVNFDEWSLKPWGEVRLRLRDFVGGSLLRLTLRVSYQHFDWMEPGPGAEKAREVSTSLYVDWEKAGSFIVRIGLIYTRHSCGSYVNIAGDVRDCSEGIDTGHFSYHTLKPSIKAIARF